MRKSLLLVAFAVMLPVVAAAQGQGGPPVVTIVGQDDINLDSKAIQDAVDAATNGTKIILVGDFQLDGGVYVESKWGLAIGASVLVQTSHITISGQKVDNDADGPANEDPENGVDDDGDGLVDEDGPDAVLKGVLVGGVPATDCDHPDAVASCTIKIADKLFNRGMRYGGETTNVTVSDLRFEGHLRATNAIGSHLNTEGHLCSGIVQTGDVQSRITIRKNVFLDNNRAFQIYGSGNQFKFQDNDVVTPAFGQLGVLLVGGSGSCYLANGSQVPIPMGVPDRTQISDNRISGGDAGIWIVRSQSTTVSGNTVSDALYGILAESENGAAILHNDVSTVGWLGMNLWGTAQGSTALNNHVVGDCYGLYVDPYSSGYRMVNNHFEGPCGDVYLDAYSSSNVLIVTDFVTSVVDLGDNMLLGTLAMINNPGVPDDVRQKLEDMRGDLGKP